MSTKKYVSLGKLSTFLDNLSSKFAALSHKHTTSEITDYKVDDVLSSTSTNPIQNKVVDVEFDAIAVAMNALENSIDNIASGTVIVKEAEYASSANTANSANTAGSANTATTASKLGSSTVGGTSQPIYLNSGTATKVTAVGTAYGGTGATTVSAARTNLDVYSKSEVDDKIPDALADLTSDSTHRTVTDAEKATWNAKSNFSGSYNDLTNQPTIPSISGLATEDYVNDIASAKVDKVSGKGLSTNDYTTTEKNKLSGIASGAEVNQNAFSNVVVGSTTIEADSKTDSLTIVAGTGISVSGDATNDKVTITNSGVRSVGAGTTNGTISVNTNGTSADVKVTGLGSAAYTASTAYDEAGTAQEKADAALASAKEYADSAATTAANAVKNDLLNGAGTAYDTLKELGDLIDDNKDAIDALESVAAGKANATHSHAISDVTNLQSALDGKANTSHGTHVTYSTTVPVMDGDASVGSATTVARSDHKHPTDTSRAAKTDFDTHVADTTKHITSTERTNWNAAKTHADSAHAPSNAEKNQNAFSNIKVGSTTIAADTTTDTLTLEGSNVTITPDATNDKVTIAVADGTTSAKGVVKLTNSTSSTSTTTAATPSSVKSAYDLANTAKTNAATAQTKADSAYSLAEGKADSNHTHNYAGSDSVGGAATSANKLNTDAGSTTQPVYFSNGVPVKTTYTLGKSVPSNAVFTDTHYSSKNVVGSTSATSNTSTALTNGNVYLNSVENGAVTSTHKISGSGATTVTTDASGNIIISSTDNDTTYSAAGSSLGLVKSGGDVSISFGVITVNDDSHNHVISNVDGLQTALDAKQATITGGATTIASSNLTASRALVSDSSGKVAVSAVTSTELGYLDGVTSAIQTQLNGKLGKTTYEYNKELAIGSTGKVCIGKFPMYDSNISVEIKSTTSTTYNGTLIIATQNINTTGGGSYTATVYGDASNSLTGAIKIQYLSGSNVFSVYIDLPSWSKNLLHIQCVALAGTPTDIATTVTEIPSTATIIPTNALKAQLDTKAASSHNHAASNITSGTLSSDRLPTVPVAKGGTGATDAATARSNLGITLANIGAAASSHNHAASNITSGTLSSDRLPTVPVAKGGTGATTAAAARTNLAVYSKTETDTAIANASEIFIATYDETTYADVLGAYNAGKACYVKTSNDFVLQLVAVSETIGAISFGSSTGNSCQLVYLYDDDSWSYETKYLLPTSGGTLTGSLTVKDNFNVNTTYDSTEYKTYVRPINYSIGNNGDYATGLIHYKGEANQAQLMFNKDGVMFRDNVNSKAYQLFGQHNVSTLATALGGAKIQTGSYTGAGKGSASYPNSLTFNFTPKVVFVAKTTGSNAFNATLVYGQNYSVVVGTTGNTSTSLTGDYVINTWSENSVSWYNPTSADCQLNKSGTTYNWVAIG